MRLISVFCLICIFLCATPLTERLFAEGSGKWLERADSLYGEGLWFEASIAYERVYYLSDDAQQRVLANLRKAEAMKQSGEFSRAAGDLQRSLVFTADDSLRAEVLYQLALCFYLDGDYSASRSFIMQLRHGRGNSSGRQEVFLLEGLVMSAQSQWNEIAGHLDYWLLESGAPGMVRDSIVQYYKVNFLLGQPDSIPDPGRAKLFSTFIPGTGQVYAGAPGWGVLNAASQLASLGAFGLMALNGYYIAAVIAGLGPFQAFYFGGIRQAGEIAEQKRNSRLVSFRAAVDGFLINVAAELEN